MPAGVSSERRNSAKATRATCTYGHPESTLPLLCVLAPAC